MRLLTLVGPGGVGKTRLALEAASGLLTEFPDGVYFVELSAIFDPDLVVPTIAATLDVREAPQILLLWRLKDFLRDRQMLLVLDNFEQVLAAAGAMGDLLDSCPDLKLLVTSRFALHLRAEQEFTVDPLALPESGYHPGRGRLSEYGSVALFVQRARAVKPDFELTPGNVKAVAEVCRRVDGLPLGIELVAGYAGLLPPQAMLARMKNPLNLLTSGATDTPNRHQTMRDTIEWSYRLLSEAEQRLFRRISVFHGSFALSAAEAVCSAPRAVGQDSWYGSGQWAFDSPGRAEEPGHIDLEPEDPRALEVMWGLRELVDKNLVSHSRTRSPAGFRPGGSDGEDPRLMMLETVREYAWEQLVASGEVDTIRQRHADYYLRFARAEAMPGETTSTEWATRLDRLSFDHDNFRAALSWLLEQGRPDSAEDALQLLMTLQDFWRRQAHLDEYRKCLARVLEEVGFEPTPLRVEALTEISDIFMRQGDYARAKELAEKALAMARELADQRQITDALMGAAMVDAVQGDYDSARSLMEECLRMHRELGDERGIAKTLNNLGEVARYQGELERAQGLYTESSQIFRALGAKLGIMLTRSNLGHVLRQLGRLREAREAYLEAISLAQEIAVAPVAAQALMGLSGVILDEVERAGASRPATGGRKDVTGGRFPALQQVARLCGAVAGLLGRSGRQLVPLEQAEFDHSVAVARARLGEEAFSEAWEEGREVSLDRIVEVADRWQLGGEQWAAGSGKAGRTGSGRQGIGGLTSRESEIASLVAAGKTNSDIARHLVLSRRTVEMHVANAMQKLGLHTRTELAAWAIAHGLVSDPS
jgi:predicted ATPase/DNA-binding CsgD family transcriptional regulator